MMRIGRLLFALVMLIAFTALVRDLGGSIWGAPSGAELTTDALGDDYMTLEPGLVRTAASVGLMLLGAFLTGRLFNRLGLAAVTGYLLFGVLIGPGALELILENELEYLELVNDLAVALIALTAGGEIRFSFLRKAWRQVVSVAGAAVGGVALGSFAALLGILPLAGIVDGAFTPAGLALAAIGATIAAANSPAVVIAVITETKAHGEMSRTALAVTVCKDLLLVIIFTIVLAVAVGRIATSTGEDGSILNDLALHLGGSIVAGVVVGLLMALYMHVVRVHLAFFVLLGGFGIALLSEQLQLETLIVAVVAGMLMENVWPEEAEPLFEQIEELSLPVYCVFFAVAGLNVDLKAVQSVWMWALVFVAVRGVLVWMSATGASKLAGGSATTTRWLWTALIPQAGIALALASIVEESLEGAGVEAGAFDEFVVTVIAIHQVVGPVLFKLALGWAGESDGGAEQPTGPSHDLSK